jgi:hypothetical protein
MQPATTTTDISTVFSITPESAQELLTFLQQGQNVAVQELNQIQPIVFDATKLSELQEVKEEYVAKLSKSKLVYEKMMSRRKEFTDPIKEKLTQIMQFENALDPTKDNNDYAKARKVIEQFDRDVLIYNKQQTEKADLEKRKTQYRVDIRTNVEKKLLEMMTGQEKGITTAMINWEAGLALDNIDAKEASLKNAKLGLSKEKYDGCFHTNFQMNVHLMTETETKEFIEGLKKEFTYEVYNEKYLQMAAPIKNAYLAKIPDIKANLEKIKGDADAEAKRKSDLAEQTKTSIASIDQQATSKLEEIEHKQEMGHLEAEFVQQGTTADLPNQASKLVAVFENEAMWLKPLLEVISHVAINGKFKLKNAKGEFVPEIQKWLTTFESCHGGKVIAGLRMDDTAKTIIKAKK